MLSRDVRTYAAINRTTKVAIKAENLKPRRKLILSQPAVKLGRSYDSAVLFATAVNVVDGKKSFLGFTAARTDGTTIRGEHFPP